MLISTLSKYMLLSEYISLILRKFKNILGCVDGCHIMISPNKDEQVAYYNYKHFHSFHLQAICLYDKRFMDIFIG